MKKLISSDESTIVKTQLKKPCSDCPFRKDSLPGWLGGAHPEEYLLLATGEIIIDCHVHKRGNNRRPQCAGAAIFRSHIAKNPRNPSILVLPPDKQTVLEGFREFLTHHKKGKV